MNFTYGEDAVYEQLMRWKPNFDKRRVSQRDRQKKTDPAKKQKTDGTERRVSQDAR